MRSIPEMTGVACSVIVFHMSESARWADRVAGVYGLNLSEQARLRYALDNKDRFIGLNVDGAKHLAHNLQIPLVICEEYGPSVPDRVISRIAVFVRNGVVTSALTED